MKIEALLSLSCIFGPSAVAIVYPVGVGVLVV